MKTIYTLALGLFLLAFTMIVAPLNTNSSVSGQKVDEIVKHNVKVAKILKKDVSSFVFVKQPTFTVNGGIN